jgi:hypothetical protein
LPCVDYVWCIMLGRFGVWVQHKPGLELAAHSKPRFSSLSSVQFVMVERA